jgi:hypothetical protein
VDSLARASDFVDKLRGCDSCPACGYWDAKRLVVEQAVTNLQRACGKAVETLLAIMQDADNPATARVSCAKAILDTAIKAVEIDDLASRIERLEEAVQQ